MADVLAHARPASTSSYFARPRPSRLLLRVHSADALRHVSSHGTYCKVYVGSTEMVRGSRYNSRRQKLSASASAHNLSGFVGSPGTASSGTAYPDTPATPGTPGMTAAHPDGYPDGSRMRVFKTQVQKGKRPNPVWDEKFDIPVADSSVDVLSIRVKSARLMSSPSIGACAISLRNLSGTTVDRWVDLMDGRKPAGRIRLQLRLIEQRVRGSGTLATTPSSSSGATKSPADDNELSAADSWLSLPDEAGPGAVAALPPHKSRRPKRRSGDADGNNGGSSTSNESEPSSERSLAASLLVAAMPGSRQSRASRRYRESRRRRASQRTMLESPVPVPVPGTPPPRPVDNQQEDQHHNQHHHNQQRHNQDLDLDLDLDQPMNDSGLDYDRASAPTHASAPATARVSFNSFVHPPTSAAGLDKTMRLNDLEQSRMDLSDLAQSRKSAKPRTSSRPAPRESSRMHFDSDGEDSGSETDDASHVWAAAAVEREPSVQIFEDDEDEVREHAQTMRLKAEKAKQQELEEAAEKTKQQQQQEAEKAAENPAEDSHREGSGETVDADDDDSDEDLSDEELEAEQPRIPLNASVMKLLCRISANVLIEEEEEEEEEDDDPDSYFANEEFVPILDFSEHEPVEDIDCA